MGIMSDLSLRLSANTADLKSGLSDAQKSLNNFGNEAKTTANKITDSFKGIDSTTSSIREMRMALNSLSGISFAGKSKEEIQAINTEIVRLRGELKKVNTQQMETGDGLKDMATNGLKSFGALGLGVLGVGGAYEGFKKTMESTVGTGDEFEVMVQQVNEATGTFFRTLATGDWSNFITNMGIAIKSGKEYGETMDYIMHKSVGNDIVNAEDKALVSEKRLQAARLSGSKDLAARKKIYEDIEVIENRILARNIQLSKVNYDAQVKKITDRGVDKNTLNDFVRYNDNGQGGDEAVSKYKELKAQYDSIFKGNKNLAGNDNLLPFNDKSLNQKTLLDAKQKLDDFLKANPAIMPFKFLIDHMNDDELKAIKDGAVRMSEDIIAANTRKMKPIKQEAMLDKKTDAAIEKAKTEYELLTVAIKDQETAINDVLTKGGTVTPEMLKNLDDEKNKLFVINSTMESIKNLSKSIKPISLSKKELLDLFPKGKDTKQKLETDKLQNGIPTPDFGADFKMKDEKNYTKFLGSEYQKRYELLKASLMKGEISEKQFATNVKGIEKEVTMFKLNVAAQAAGDMASLFGQQTVAYKALAIAQIGIATTVAAIAALMPPPIGYGPLLGPWAAAGIITGGAVAAAKVMGFESGGVVGGSSYSGDKVPVRVNSGEMILNKSQQSRLFAIANNGSTHSGSFGAGGELTTKVSGTDLMIVLKNTNNKISRTR